MPEDFRLYNTLSRTIEPFEPLQAGKVSLYVCGMTVYDHVHVGHARAFVVFDAFTRYLRSRGWDVTFVRNHTDVDDKIIRRAQEQGIEPMALAQRYIDAVTEDMAALGLDPPDAEPRVSTSMDAIRAMVQRLVDSGHAYPAGGSVWFSVSTFPEYGRLSGQKPDEMKSSPETDSVKRDPRDFAIWKAAKAGEPAWESPWGPGRPGWHIECSAMNHEAFGPSLDIHGGGLDLVFPHHENEIAQSVCANGAPYANVWMHNGMLTMAKRTAEGQVLSNKMGKSLGNVVNVRDALVEFPAEVLRLYYLQAHYRSALPWSVEALPEALAMLARLYEARDNAEAMGGSEPAADVIASLGDDAKAVHALGVAFPERFHAAMSDDMNTAQALAHAFELARAINRFANHKKANKRGGPVVAPALAALKLLGTINLLTMSCRAFEEQVKDKRTKAMGIDRDHVEALLRQRTEARASKDWGRADEIRDELDALDIVVMDRADGVDWKLRLIAD